MKEGKQEMVYAEDRPYWDTTVHPGKSMGEIQEMLEEFGAANQIVTQGQAKGQFAWLIRFQWNDRTYRFLFTPLPCRRPDQVWSIAKQKRKGSEQAKWQMGRTAVWFVKAILTAAEANPHALFGFLELPADRQSGLPPTAAELDVCGLTGLLPPIEISTPLLNEGGEEGIDP